MTILINKEEISLVCQGLLKSDSLILEPSVVSNYFNNVNKIIVSFWNTEESRAESVLDKMSFLKQTWGDKLVFINNDLTPLEEITYQAIATRANLYNQMSSTFYGLSECNTKYCIKTRTDECYENLQPLIDKFCSFMTTQFWFIKIFLIFSRSLRFVLVRRLIYNLFSFITF